MTVDELAGRRALVTGGTGFIGSHLCNRLHELGVEVFGTSRRPVDSGSAGVTWLLGDLAEIADARAALEAAEPDIVFHLAGHVSGDRSVELVLPTFRDGLLSCVNLLTAATEGSSPLIVLAGSMEEPPPGTTAEAPASPYAVAKWAASGYAGMFTTLYALPVAVLRIFMVYGPGQRDATKLIPYVMRSLLRGERPRLSSGARPVDWIFVDDVVDAFVAAALSEPSGGAVDVGSGTAVTIRQLVDKIVAMTNPEIEPEYGAIPNRAHETTNVADVAGTEAAIGWRPRTTLDRGLQETLEWFARDQDVELPTPSA